MTSFPTPMQPEDFDILEDILDDLRTRNDETPSWEFCEGFMAALLCMPKAPLQEEWMPMLLGFGDQTDAEFNEGGFASPEQASTFISLWQRRSAEIEHGLQAEVEGLDDENAYAPEVIDLRGNFAALSTEELADMDEEMTMDELPSFAQVWAMGFMFVVENWPEEWVAPGHEDMAQVFDESINAIVALTEDDADEPVLNPFDDESPASVSEGRLDDYADAIWAVYNLWELKSAPIGEAVVIAAE